MEPLAQRVAEDERFELADERRVAPERDVGVEPILEARQPQLLQPPGLGLGERLAELGEGRAPPQCKRVAQLASRSCGCCRLEGGAAGVAEELGSKESMGRVYVNLGEMLDWTGGSPRRWP